MNNAKIDIQTLLQKNMSRKEFLRVSGAAVLGIVGVTSMMQGIQRLAGTQPTPLAAKSKVSSGYGGSAYGK